MMHKRPPFSSLRTAALERIEDERDLKLIRKAGQEKTIPWKVIKKKLGLRIIYFKCTAASASFGPDAAVSRGFATTGPYFGLIS